MWVAAVMGVVFVVWMLLSFKTSRPDGVLVAKVPPFRRLMFYIMAGRNESIVFFDRKIRAENLTAYLAESKAFGGDMSHLLVGAFNIGLAENPKMNQFVVGRRLYARNGRWLSFSMKRKSMSKKAKLSVVKTLMKDGETFKEMCDRINDQVGVERSGKKTSADVEYDWFNLLPRPLLRGAASALRSLDYFNLLPNFFIEGDGMYTSIFLANLGSVGMAPGYHHLYEYGTCPLFVMVGRATDEPVVEDGKVVVGKVLTLRFSYDERIEDGLTARYGMDSVQRVLENPQRWLGCIKSDGSDTRPMFPHGENVDLGDDSAVAEEK